ncbi:MAG: hypothetical protein AAF773_00100 [Cyanobacteria bacterium P01_D01_bin.115]
MDYAAALKALKALDVENAADLVSAIEGKVTALETKNFEIIGEKRTATQKTQAMQTALEAIAKAVGVEGEIDAVLETTQSKVSGLASENAQLKTASVALETRATEAEGKVQGFERKDKVSDLASAAGANAAVLEKLLGDRLDDLKVEGEGDSRTVKLGDKSLKEYVESDDGLKAFAPALFPGEKTGEKTQPKLPSGGPSGGDQSPDVLQNYLSRRRTGAKQLTDK